MAKFLKSFGLPALGGLAGSFLGGKVLSPMLSQQFGKTAGGYLGSALGGAAGGAISGALTGGKAGKSALIGGGTGLASQAVSNFMNQPTSMASKKTSAPTAIAPSTSAGSSSAPGVLARRRDIGNILGLPTATRGRSSNLRGMTMPSGSESWDVGSSYSSPYGTQNLRPQQPSLPQSASAGLAQGLGQGAGEALASAFRPSFGQNFALRPSSSGGGDPAPQNPPPGGGGAGFAEDARRPDIFGIDMENAKKAGIQGAFGLAGDVISPTPEVPNLGNIPSIESLRSSAGLPQTELGQLAQTRLSEQLNAPFGLEPGVEQNISRVFDERRKSLISQFKTIRPNADLTSDTAFRQAMYNLDQQEAETMSMARQRAYDTFQTQRRADIAQALGVDEQRLEVLIQAANLDIQQIMMQFGLDAQRASEFKQAFTQLGAILTGQQSGEATQ